MNCPVCKAKIGFMESLTVLNPFSFKCRKCSSLLSLDRSSIKVYILLLCVISAFSFTFFYLLTTNNALNANILKFIIPAILLTVVLLHYLFWNNATARLKKEENGPDATNFGCWHYPTCI